MFPPTMARPKTSESPHSLLGRGQWGFGHVGIGPQGLWGVDLLHGPLPGLSTCCPLWSCVFAWCLASEKFPISLICIQNDLKIFYQAYFQWFLWESLFCHIARDSCCLTQIHVPSSVLSKLFPSGPHCFRGSVWRPLLGPPLSKLSAVSSW